MQPVRTLRIAKPPNHILSRTKGTEYAINIIRAYRPSRASALYPHGHGSKYRTTEKH